MTLHPHAARWRRSLLRTAVVSLAVTSALSVVPAAAVGKLSRGNFPFGSAGRIVNHARRQNQQLRGHTLVWHSQLPGWISAIRDANTLRSVMNNHINQLAGRWRGQLRPSVFRDVLGTGFIAEAFRTARAADPAPKLCYDDYSIEDWNAAKTQGVYRMASDFRSRGVPIDCVGLQAHFGSGGPPGTFRTTLYLQRAADRVRQHRPGVPERGALHRYHRLGHRRPHPRLQYSHVGTEQQSQRPLDHRLDLTDVAAQPYR